MTSFVVVMLKGRFGGLLVRVLKQMRLNERLFIDGLCHFDLVELYELVFGGIRF